MPPLQSDLISLPTLTRRESHPDMSASALKKALYAASASAVRTNLPTKTKVAAKSAPSAYILFSKDERPKLGSELKGGDIMKELGKRWSGLNDAARKPYVDQALKLKSELKSAPGACAAQRPGPQPVVAHPPRLCCRRGNYGVESSQY